MNVSINKACKEHLRKKEINIITLSFVVTRCWAGAMRNPSIGYNLPDDTIKYEVYHDEEFTIYVHKSLPATSDDIEFVLDGFWFFKTPYAKGLKLNI